MPPCKGRAGICQLPTGKNGIFQKRMNKMDSFVWLSRAGKSLFWSWTGERRVQYLWHLCRLRRSVRHHVCRRRSPPRCSGLLWDFSGPLRRHDFKKTVSKGQRCGGADGSGGCLLDDAVIVPRVIPVKNISKEKITCTISFFSSVLSFQSF